MTWELIHSVSDTASRIVIPHAFTDSLIIVEAICTEGKSTWNKAGYLYPVMAVTDIGIVRGTSKTIYLNKQSVQFAQLLTSTYSLEFVAVDWLPNITLNFWENDMPLYPINVPDTNSPLTSSQFTSSNVQVNNSTVTKIVSANSARKELTIYNPDTRNSVYLDVVNTVSATIAAFIIPPGQAYVSDLHWVGDVYAITKAGTITLTVREFT